MATAISYSERFASPPRVYTVDYAVFYDRFDVNNVNHQPANLRDMVVNNDKTEPLVLLYYDESDDRIRYVHRATLVAPTMSTVNPYDGNIYAFASDVTPSGSITTVRFPAQPFVRTTAQYVKTEAAMTQAWVDSAGADRLGPFAVTDADTEQVRTRFFCVVPAIYTSLVLDHGTFTSLSLWNDLGLKIIQDGLAVSCKPVLDFIRCCGTYSAPGAVAGDPPQPPTVAHAPLTVPLADALLHSIVQGWIYTDLPNLRGQLGGAAQQMTHSVNLMVTEMATRRAEEQQHRAQQALPPTLSKKSPAGAAGVRALTQSATDADLPPYWKVYPTITKAEATFMLAQAVDARAKEPDSRGHAPVITPVIMENLKYFRFGTSDIENLTDGLSIFNVVNQNSGIRATQARERAEVYATLQAGGGTASVAEIRRLTNDAPATPASMLEFNQLLDGYSVLLDVVLGVNQPLAVMFRTFSSEWASISHLVQLQFGIGTVQMRLPQILHFIQLRCAMYFNRATSNPNHPVPQLTELIDKAMLKDWSSLPTYPERYQVAPEPPPALPPAAPGAGAAPPPATPAVQQTRVNNPNPIAALVNRFTAYGNHLRVLTANGLARPLPRNDNGDCDMCLSYHFRGACLSGCRRHPTHRAATPTELAAMNEMLTRCGVAE